MAAKKRSALGRDLDVLLGVPESEANESEGAYRFIKLDSLHPGRYQPRKAFDEESLEELVASIREHGVLDPILVRAIGAQKFEIIGGERRWRAARQAGLAEIPALVRELSDQQVALIALVENIQREDLAPLEVAQSLKQLMAEFKFTQEQAADKIGRSRAAVANLLRLLGLPEPVKQLLSERKIDMGHARALITLEPKLATRLAHQAAEHGWSVRELEEAARRAQGASKGKAKTKSGPARDADIVALERELAEKLAAKVSVQHGRGGRGKLVIAYHSLDELEGILERIR
ncbi:MAG: ParB/RepB/Spo0J family partition protein [Xanthomonadaceae bacterium]|nr:ParB/RepB/Spo0J family partition protein [Xanthomonadaceae bacterium]